VSGTFSASRRRPPRRSATWWKARRCRAAGVAEGAAKPESTIAMSEVTEAVRKLATVLPISEELLEDAPSIQSYLNGRLSLFISIEEERQLLRGLGAGSNELLGIFGRSGINTYTKLGTDDSVTALARVIANTRGSSFLQPDTVILHPTQWTSMRLLRDGAGGTIGAYFGAGPFGPSANKRRRGIAVRPEPLGHQGCVVHGRRVGDRAGGQFRPRRPHLAQGGVSVDATNSHSDLFVENITLLRAEERLALGVYRPSAFTAVSDLT
jgi:Phage capsid family